MERQAKLVPLPSSHTPTATREQKSYDIVDSLGGDRVQDYRIAGITQTWGGTDGKIDAQI